MPEGQIHLSVDPESGTTNLSEKDVANISPTSALSWDRAKSILRLPEEVSKLRVLDVGAGASDITAALLSQGADAYAVDPKYNSKSNIRGQIQAQLKTPYYVDRKREVQETLERFMESIKTNPDHYKTAMGTNMPFSDDFFDVVFSLGAISGYLDVDRNLFLAAIQECLRVLKPGGTLQLMPFLDRISSQPEGINQLRLSNDAYVKNWLEKNPQIAEVSVNETNLGGQHLLIATTHLQ